MDQTPARQPAATARPPRFVVTGSPSPTRVGCGGHLCGYECDCPWTDTCREPSRR